MTDPVNKTDETRENQVKEEEVSTNETDDFKLFIRKTQLQNRILKKITENMKHPADSEMNKHKSKS